MRNFYRTVFEKKRHLGDLKGDRGFTTITLDSRYYNSELELINEINKKMKPALRCDIDNENKVSVYISEFDEFGDIDSFYFKQNLRDILGLPRTGEIGGETENGLYTPILSGKAVVQSDQKANLNKGLSGTLTICTDLVLDQIVNNTHARVLRTFETEAHTYKHGFTKRVEFSKLVFLPVSKNKIEYIDLLVKDDTGHEAIFSHGSLTAILLFRKVGHE